MARTKRFSAPWALTVWLGLSAALLTGCSTVSSTVGAMLEPEAVRPCPLIAPVGDAAKLTRFSGQGRDLTDVLFEAELTEVAGFCSYDGNLVQIESKVRFIASRGPADTARRAEFKYFVAVATRDKAIKGRNVFSTVVEFPGNTTRAATVEELEQEFTLAEGKSGEDYVIYVGFELTSDEVEFNRKQTQ